MKKNIVISILSIIALIVISSCGDNGTNPSSNDEILPLKVGNYWKFDVIGYDSLGNIREKLVTTYMIISDTIINSEKVYSMKIGDSDPEYIVFYVKRTDGIYIKDKSSINLQLKYPISEGEKYITKNATITVESINYNFFTPIGNFSCYQYTNNSSKEFKASFYLKPGIGFIAQEIYDNTYYGILYLKYRYILKEYKVN